MSAESVAAREAIANHAGNVHSNHSNGGVPPHAPNSESIGTDRLGNAAPRSDEKKYQSANQVQNHEIHHLTNEDLAAYEIKKGKIHVNGKPLNQKKEERKSLNFALKEAADFKKAQIHALSNRLMKLEVRNADANSDEVVEIRRHIAINRDDQIKLEEMLQANKRKREKIIENPIMTGVTSIGGLFIGVMCMYPIIQPLFAKKNNDQSQEQPQASAYQYPYGAGGY